MNDLLTIFQSFRRILCICPCCGEMVRLSDLQLKYSGKAPKTWRDRYDSQLLKLEKSEERFEEKESKIREKSIERGRKKVPQLVKNCLCPEFKKLSFDPYDIKALMHPVDFVVFNGLNNGIKVDDVTFLSRPPSTDAQTQILKTIKETIAQKNYDWKVARITVDGEVGFE